MTKSPCTGQCLIQIQKDGVKTCSGCYRTLEEIRNWSSLDEESKQTILQNCNKRKLGDSSNEENP